MGQRLLEQGCCQESIPYFKKFISELNEKPYLSKLIWLSWPVHTTKAEAMALNSLGITYLELGETEEADKYFRSAISVDSAYPLPYFNMALISVIRGDLSHALQYFEKAREFGVKQSAIDKIVNEWQYFLTSVEEHATDKYQLSDLDVCCKLYEHNDNDDLVAIVIYNDDKTSMLFVVNTLVLMMLQLPI